MSPTELARMTFDEADHQYRTGRLSQDEYEAYRHAWAVHPSHEGYSLARGWVDPSEFPSEVAELAAEILAVIAT